MLFPAAALHYNVRVMKRMRQAQTWIAIALAALAGCDGTGQVYAPTTGGYLGADISPKGQWKVVGTLANLDRITDEDMTTAATAGGAGGPAELTIDLGRACVFQTVIIDHGRGQYGYCRKVAASSSVNGKVFLDQYAGPGTRRVTILCLPQPVLARHLRLRVVEPGAQPWNVAEVYLQ